MPLTGFVPLQRTDDKVTLSAKVNGLCTKEPPARNEDYYSRDDDATRPRLLPRCFIMSSLLPPEIEVSERGDVTRFRLPPRRIGPWRLIGLAPLLFGLAFAAGPLSWAIGALNFARFDPCSLIFVAFTFPFIWSGLWLARIGVLILAARSEVELRRDQLVAIERWGPVRWTRKLPLEVIRKFVVQGGAAEGQHGSAVPAFLTELAAIMVESATEKKAMLLTPAYPLPQLLPLAEELARRCNVDMEQKPGELARPVVAVVQQLMTPEDAEPPVSLKQPDESDIEVEEAADGVTLKVPPAGVWEGSKGLLVFSIFWNGFMAIVTGAFVFSNDGPKGKDLFIVVPFFGLFWAVGIGLALGAINMGKRRAVLAVVGDRLLALQTGIFGGKRQQWQKEEILEIRSGPSGMTVNDVPVLELQIVPVTGSKFGMLSGRDETELRWVAAKLRHALRIKWQDDGTTPFRERAEQPDTSDVNLEQRGDGLTLTVPPAGIFSGSKGLMTVALGWNGIVGIITAVLIGVLVWGQTEVWFGLLILSIFWVIGLALLLGAVHMGTRRAVLAVVGEELLVMQTSIFGKKEHRWQRGDVNDIRTGPSGMKVNDRHILELHIMPKDGAKVGMLAGREHDELDWLATVLRRALKLLPPDDEPVKSAPSAEEP